MKRQLASKATRHTCTRLTHWSYRGCSLPTSQIPIGATGVRDGHPASWSALVSDFAVIRVVAVVSTHVLVSPWTAGGEDPEDCRIDGVSRARRPERSPPGSNAIYLFLLPSSCSYD